VVRKRFFRSASTAIVSKLDASNVTMPDPPIELNEAFDEGMDGVLLLIDEGRAKQSTISIPILVIEASTGCRRVLG